MAVSRVLGRHGRRGAGLRRRAALPTTSRSTRLGLQQLEDRRLLAADLLAGGLPYLAAEQSAPAVSTDKADYLPGEFVLITASGFPLAATLEFSVLHNDGTPNTGEGHTPWQVADGGPGDPRLDEFGVWFLVAGRAFHPSCAG